MASLSLAFASGYLSVCWPNPFGLHQIKASEGIVFWFFILFFVIVVEALYQIYQDQLQDILGTFGNVHRNGLI